MLAHVGAPQPERVLSVVVDTPGGPLELHNAHIPPAPSNGLAKVETWEIDIPFAVASVTLGDVHRISEAMLTGTGFCLAGVREYHHYWNPRPRRFEWPGPVFRKLLAAWSDLSVTAQSMRTILTAASTKLGRRAHLDIVD